MSKFVYLKQPFEGQKQNEIGILIKSSSNTSVINIVNLNKEIEIPNYFFEEFDPKKTGDQFDKKVCNICNRLLPVNYFEKNQNAKDNRTVRRPSCYDCRQLINGESLSASDKRKWERVKPNYVVWECPICKKRTIPGLTSKVVLDHDHITGKPRAWICDSCNTGLGRFKDNIETIENAITYLKDKNK